MESAKARERQRQYYLAHRDVVLARAKKRYASDPEHARRRQAAYRLRNAALIAEDGAKWGRENKGTRNAITARRFAAKLQATPAWADRLAIRAMYEAAAAATELFGVPVQVDHIVPLQSPTIRGLHVEYNLQLLTRRANQSKGNKYAT